MRTEPRCFAGHEFLVVDPASIGYPQHTLHTFDDHEPCFLKYWGKVRLGEFVIDAGPCFGSYTLPALAMGAIVLAFEPFDEARAILHANGEANRCGRNLVLSQRALWDGSPYPEALSREVWGTHYPTQSPLQCTTLDEELQLFGGPIRVDWIKSDVEGAELGLLLGALAVLQAYRPSLIIEDHDGVDPNPACAVSSYPTSVHSSRRIHGLLDALGYDVEVMRADVSRKWICAVHPSRPEHRP